MPRSRYFLQFLFIRLLFKFTTIPQTVDINWLWGIGAVVQSGFCFSYAPELMKKAATFATTSVLHFLTELILNPDTLGQSKICSVCRPV